MNNEELIAAGHELAKFLDSNTPLLDIAKLLSKMATQLDVTTAALREKTKQCEQLAAENAALNEKMNTLATWPDIEFYSSSWEFNNGDGNDALEFMCDVQTPATDAFIAEQRAQGVEMLADHLSGLGISASETSVREFAAHLRQGGAA